MLPDAFWAVAGSVLGIVSSIATLQIVSRLIPTEEYGQASLVLGVTSLLTQFIVGPKVLAHQRLYFEHAQSGRGPAYVTAVRKLLLGTGAWLSVVYLGIAALGLAIGHATYWTLAAPALLLLALQPQLGATFGFLEAERRYRGLAIAQSSFKLVQLPFLIGLLHMSVAGPSAIVGSQGLATTVVIFTAGLWGLRSPHAARAHTKAAFTSSAVAHSASTSFGWSLYGLTLSTWLLSTSDRYLVDHFASTRDVGIYVANYSLWCMPYVTLNAVLELIVRSRMFQRSELGDWAGVRRIIQARMATAAVLGGLGTWFIFLAGERVAKLVIGSMYWHGGVLMILISVAHVLFIVGMSYYSLFVSAKRVGALVAIMLGASGVNVGLNVILIPRLGITGAGWSILVTFGVLTLALQFAGHRLLTQLIRGSGGTSS